LPDNPSELALARWRLILGRFAEQSLGGCLGQGPGYTSMDRVLDYLYGREYRGRGVRDDLAREGGAGSSVFAIPEWLGHVRKLFPRDTVEVIQRHALDRYQMTELVTDPEVLKQMEPNYDLLKTLMTFKGMMKGPVLEMARKIVREVVEELRRKLAKQVKQAMWGKLNRKRRTHIKVFRNLDIQRTIRDNLKNYDPERQQIILDRLHFFSRTRHHMPWHVIMAIDCSGSMLDSVIHSAVMAGIFNGLPTVQVNLIAFDTEIVDFSGHVNDPTELLMSVQLGGGTDIGGALQYCEQLVRSPTRTIVVLVTDFFEGGPAGEMLASIKRLKEANAKVLGLAALDQDANPIYDHQMAERCIDAGAEVAALTPGKLAEWLANVIS